ncbi:MAG: leucyl aminopeptidase [Proteobacteria bacterium]|nr:leucyl aminopeptidase [Pseudomonadota bacterium]MBU1717150.1 leucyl aminopeptidase [Pseudomonadota bacterium]
MITVTAKTSQQYSGDMCVYFVRQLDNKKTMPVSQDKEVQEIIKRAYDVGDFFARAGETVLHYPGPGTGAKPAKSARRILVVGLGKDDLDREVFRLAGGTASATALKKKAYEFMAVLPDELDFPAVEMAQGLAEGLILGAYQFVKYKTKFEPDEKPGEIKNIMLSTRHLSAVRKGVKTGSTEAFAGCRARDMANEPGNYWTPAQFAERGRELAAEYGFKCKVYGLAELKKMGMGGIIGVNQGSGKPPTMVVLEYRTGKKVPTLLLVGKGLTFDSGGISLKPGAGMQDMKYDMCGGAAVIAAMQAIGEISPARLDVVAIVPATENLPGHDALKPGDIITQYNGKTVEVVNTDAEGRLILADALSWGVKKYKPDAVVDLATLTGAVIVGLGHHRTGLMSNNDALAEKIMAAGEKSAEPLWRLPLGKEYAKQLESKVADLKNVGTQGAGTITAGAFLEEFVGETPWAHLDIAGTAWDFTEKSYVPKGPSGVGVRTIIELIRAWK